MSARTGPCPECNGTGKVTSGGAKGATCQKCNGTGQQPRIVGRPRHQG